MNRRNFLKLVAAAFATKALPVRALSVVAPELVVPSVDLDGDRYDLLDVKSWGRVKYGTAPFWFGVPHWMDSAHTSTYAGISRTRLP
jgi:hypothetical protein